MTGNVSLEYILREPHTVGPHTDCAEASRVMRDENVSTVVVTEDERPLGIVTDRDITVRLTARGADPESVVVSEIMSGDAVFLALDRRIDEALEIMQSMHVGKLPIVDADGVLIGVITTDDILVTIASELQVLAQVVHGQSREQTEKLRFLLGEVTSQPGRVIDLYLDD
jgi:CBS domain-containing protein